MTQLLATRALAKVNLTLSVHGRRADGYHLIESVVVFSGAADRVKLDLSSARRDVSVSGPFAADIAGENLLVRALALLGTFDPALKLGAVHIWKELPVAAGIGGGSADAGALLRLVRAANPGRGSESEWADLALQLGADVPVSMRAEPALMYGIGEHLLAIDGLPPFGLLLVNPQVAVPMTKTRDVFRALSAAPVSEMPDPVRPPIAPEDFAVFLELNGNDLTPAAVTIVPAINDVLAGLAATPGCRIARLSGAGPTCFGLYATQREADIAARQLSARRPDWWVSAEPYQPAKIS